MEELETEEQNVHSFDIEAQALSLKMIHERRWEAYNSAVRNWGKVALFIFLMLQIIILFQFCHETTCPDGARQEIYYKCLAFPLEVPRNDEHGRQSCKDGNLAVLVRRCTKEEETDKFDEGCHSFEVFLICTTIVLVYIIPILTFAATFFCLIRSEGDRTFKSVVSFS